MDGGGQAGDPADGQRHGAVVRVVLAAALPEPLTEQSEHGHVYLMIDTTAQLNPLSEI